MNRDLLVTVSMLLVVGGWVAFAMRPNDLRFFNLDLGEVPAQSLIEGELKVHNRTEATRSVLGVRSSCECVVTGDFPVTLAAGEIANIPISVSTPTPGRELVITLHLYTDSPGIGMHTVTVTGMTKS